MASEGYYDVKHELFILISNLKGYTLKTVGVENNKCTAWSAQGAELFRWESKKNPNLVNLRKGSALVAILVLDSGLAYSENSTDIFCNVNQIL